MERKRGRGENKGQIEMKEKGLGNKGEGGLGSEWKIRMGRMGKGWRREGVSVSKGN